MSERRKPGENLAFDFTPKADPIVEYDEGVLPQPPSKPPPPPQKLEPEVITVGQLGRMVGRTLERGFFDPVWVEGEVSGARPAASGHLYFSLKDEEEEAVVDVVVFRTNVTPRARTLVKDGARVRVRGKPTFWPPRGRLQFVADRLAPTGKGAILEALELLKEKLRAEGLFDPTRKRELPHEPRIVGVVTSRSGAVIHDICKVAFRRGGAHILLAAAQVQGAGSVDSVRRALRMLQRIPEVDVIVVGRGGGSQDELMTFNDEHLVREIAACRVPVVSAVGHETDVTLVDFVADRRAATPSQAAEMVVPDRAAQLRLLEERGIRLRRAMHARITEERVRTEKLARAFRDPRLLIANAQQRLDDRFAALGRAMNRRLARERELTTKIASRLASLHPRAQLAKDAARLAALRARLDDRMLARLARERASVGGLAGRLDAMSPLKVLGRGYAIATKDGRAVRDASEVAAGDRVHVRVAQGSFDAEVVAKEDQ